MQQFFTHYDNKAVESVLQTRYDNEIQNNSYIAHDKSKESHHSIQVNNSIDSAKPAVKNSDVQGLKKQEKNTDVNFKDQSSSDAYSNKNNMQDTNMAVIDPTIRKYIDMRLSEMIAENDNIKLQLKQLKQMQKEQENNVLQSIKQAADKLSNQQVVQTKISMILDYIQLAQDALYIGSNTNTSIMALKRGMAILKGLPSHQNIDNQFFKFNIQP